MTRCPFILSPRIATSITISLLILGFIYWQVDIVSVLNVLLTVNVFLFSGSLFILIPTLLLSGLRFNLLLHDKNRPSVRVATKLILAGATMNMFLPSKMGDVLKSIFMQDALNMRLSLAVSVVVFEKACDFLGLLAWCLLGLVIYAGDNEIFIALAFIIGGGLAFGVLMISSLSFADFLFRLASKIAPSSLADKIMNLRDTWAEVHEFFWRSQRSVLNIVFLSLLIWLLHLFQIWLLILSLHVPVPLLSSLGLSSLVIFAGLVPFTLAGLGTRDVAVIFLFAPFMTSSVAAALGLMLTLRFLLPGIAGLPFLTGYIDVLRKQRISDLTIKSEGSGFD
jgi:uncharacterized protein (TIRG00374 family)